MTDNEKVTEIRKFTKMEELDKWFEELIFPGKTKDFILELESHGVVDGEVSRRICFYTEEHQYFINAIDKTKDDGYLGCQVNCRKVRAGEDWVRGNDLPDGKFNKTTWDRILRAILNYELVKLSDFKKPELGDNEHGNDIRST
jgi:hypothetical protein